MARLSRSDNLHQAANAWPKACASYPLVTTDSVLSEVQTFFAERGANFRKLAVTLVETLENDPNVVILSDHEHMRQGRQLYKDRPDKGYSMADCLSMVVMKARGIQCVLTADHHFQQEGFTALLLLSPSAARDYLP